MGKNGNGCEPDVQRMTEDDDRRGRKPGGGIRHLRAQGVERRCNVIACQAHRKEANVTHGITERTQQRKQ